MDKTYKNDKELVKKGKELLGRSLYDLYKDKSNIGNSSNKGGLGLALEKLHYGIENNNKKEPDVKNLNIEIKSNPLVIKKDGEPTPKEGVSLGMIDFDEISKEKFETSQFLKKNGKVLYNMYIHEKGQKPNKNKFALVDLVELSGSDLRIMKREWELIQSYVKKNKADELSRGMTNYLMAVTKSDKASTKRTYGNGSKAKPRALGFKHAYIRELLSRYKVQKDSKGNLILKSKTVKQYSIIEHSKSNDIESAVLDKFKKYLGKRFEDIAKELDKTLLNPSNKSRYAFLTSVILTGERKKELSKHIEEFAKSGITVKTIRVNEDMKPKEEVSFKTLNRYDMIESTWETSRFYDEVSCPFLWVVYEEKNNGDTILKDVFFWKMEQKDIDAIGKKWKSLKKMIEKNDHRDSYFMDDDSFYYLKIKDSMGGKSAEFNGKKLVKLAHWFTKKYVQEKILMPHIGKK